MQHLTFQIIRGFLITGIIWAQATCGLPAWSQGEPTQVPPPANTLYPPLSVGAASRQIPPGIRLKIMFITPLDSKTTNVGDIFLAQAAEDLWAGDYLILPKGTPVRGRVKQVERPGFFSKGGLIRLNFEHVQMPSGTLMPLSLELDPASEKVDPQKDAFYTDPGMGAKLNNSVDKGIAQFKSFHEKGIEAGQARGGGAHMLYTVPTNTVAGVATGTVVTTVNAAKAIFGRGENVSIQPGDQVIIDFSKAATLQAQ